MMNFQLHLVTAWKTVFKFLFPMLLMTLLTAVLSAVTLGILFPVFYAGYVNAVFLMLREGRSPGFKDLFSRFKLALGLVLFFLTAEVFIAVGAFLYVIPGALLTIILTYLFLYLIPLMSDQGMGLIAAAKMSMIMTTKGNLLDNLVVYLLAAGLTMFGLSTGVLWLFTVPFVTVFILSVYEEKRVK